METTAAIPNTMEAIKSSNLALLAFASRQAILKSQAGLLFDFNGDLFKFLQLFHSLKSYRLLILKFAVFLLLNLNRE